MIERLGYAAAFWAATLAAAVGLGCGLMAQRAGREQAAAGPAQPMQAIGPAAPPGAALTDLEVAPHVQVVTPEAPRGENVR